jgi:uncharacterized protein (TIGR02996 family)
MPQEQRTPDPAKEGGASPVGPGSTRESSGHRIRRAQEWDRADVAERIADMDYRFGDERLFAVLRQYADLLKGQAEPFRGWLLEVLKRFAHRFMSDADHAQDPYLAKCLDENRVPCWCGYDQRQDLYITCWFCVLKEFLSSAQEMGLASATVRLIASSDMEGLHILAPDKATWEVPLRAALNSADRWERCRAAAVLGDFFPERTDLIGPLFQDEDPVIRGCAAIHRITVEPRQAAVLLEAVERSWECDDVQRRLVSAVLRSDFWGRLGPVAAYPLLDLWDDPEIGDKARMAFDLIGGQGNEAWHAIDRSVADKFVARLWNREWKIPEVRVRAVRAFARMGVLTVKVLGVLAGLRFGGACSGDAKVDQAAAELLAQIFTANPRPSARPATEEEAFLLKMLYGPKDENIFLVYADWLEERGDPMAEYVRFSCSLSAAEQDMREILLAQLDDFGLLRGVRIWAQGLDWLLHHHRELEA